MLRSTLAYDFQQILFRPLSGGTALDESAGGGVATGAACRALGKQSGRRPARLPEGEPAKPGEPRRGAPPKAQADAVGGGAEREARRVGEPIGRYGASACAVG